MEFILIIEDVVYVITCGIFEAAEIVKERTGIERESAVWTTWLGTTGALLLGSQRLGKRASRIARSTGASLAVTAGILVGTLGSCTVGYLLEETQ